MTATKQFGVTKGLRSALASATATVALFLISASALAQNVLQDVRYSAAPGGKVDITLQFAGPVGEVQAFTTDSPPRIAIDLPGTSNGLAQRRVARPLVVPGRSMAIRGGLSVVNAWTSPTGPENCRVMSTLPPAAAA